MRLLWRFLCLTLIYMHFVCIIIVLFLWMEVIRMKRVIALLPLPLALLLRLFALSHPKWVETFFSGGIYPKLAAPVSRAFRVVSFPLGEILVVIFLLFCIYLLFRKRFFAATALFLVLPAVFIGGFGLNYLRLPLEKTLSIDTRPMPVSTLVALCEKLTRDANGRYAEPSGDLLLPAGDALNAAAGHYPIPKGKFGAPKFALSSPLLSRFLIAGITSPFTLEALVNGGIPEVSIPFVACHESAHLRGFAREEDANLVAYLACEFSNDPYYRYSGAISALQYAQRALREADPEAYGAVCRMVSENVLRDLSACDVYWAAFRQTKAAEVGARVNDAYLQTVGGGDQSGRSYGRVVDLLLGIYAEEAK